MAKDYSTWEQIYGQPQFDGFVAESPLADPQTYRDLMNMGNEAYQAAAPYINSAYALAPGAPITGANLAAFGIPALGAMQRDELTQYEPEVRKRIKRGRMD